MRFHFIALLILSISTIAGSSTTEGYCSWLQKQNPKANSVSLLKSVDVQTLYAGLRALNAPRREFETTEEHLKRKRALLKTKKIGTYSLLDTFMVAKAISSYYFHYEADSQTVRIEFLFGIDDIPFGMKYPGDDDPGPEEYAETMYQDTRVLELKRIPRDGGSYKASNGFGVTATVKRSYPKTYNLVLGNIWGDVNCEGQHVEFKASRNQAIALKENLVLVTYFDVRKPYAVETSFYVEPKIDNPVEIYSTEYNVIGHVLSSHIVDKRNGRILASFEPETITPEEPEQP